MVFSNQIDPLVTFGFCPALSPLPHPTMKTALIATGCLFLLFAALQYNDSNAAVWAAMFTVTGLLTLARAFNRAPRALLWTVSAACLAGAIWTATHEILNPGCMIGTDVPGPTLCAIWLAVLAWLMGRTKVIATPPDHAEMKPDQGIAP